jgi:hypothetical protein
MSSGSELIYDLKKRGGFWSYSEDILDTIPDTLLIEEALRRGEVKDIKLLFDLFSVKKIKQVWKEKIIPDKRIYGHNYYLAKIFFNINAPGRYIKSMQKKYNRYERIKNATS